jgi:hypothetical protein
MAIWAWVLIAIVVVAAVALIALVARQRRTALQRRFGPEYDRTVAALDDQRAAEADLRERERQRARLDIGPLPEDTRARFAQEWQDLQERFVDQPSEAVVAADGLVYRIMEARGYPMGDTLDRVSRRPCSACILAGQSLRKSFWQWCRRVPGNAVLSVDFLWETPRKPVLVGILWGLTVPSRPSAISVAALRPTR